MDIKVKRTGLTPHPTLGSTWTCPTSIDRGDGFDHAAVDVRPMVVTYWDSKNANRVLRA
jgi:hypothetical protein